MKNLIILSMVLMMFLIPCCMTSMEVADHIVGGSQPVEYKEGFIDGRNSGFASVGFADYRFGKDVNRYDSDQLYKQGWDDGFVYGKNKAGYYRSF